MATGPIEKHLHRSFNWENAAPGARKGTRGRSAGCGNDLSAQCVRLRSEINLSKYLERDDIRDIEGPSVNGIVCGKQQHATVEQVEHDLGACVTRSGI